MNVCNFNIVFSSSEKEAVGKRNDARLASNAANETEIITLTRNNKLKTQTVVTPKDIRAV